MPNKISLEEVKKKLEEKHGNEITLNESTYIKVTSCAQFIDKDFGSWWAKPYKILSGQSHPDRRMIKIKQTMLKIYGVENASQAKEIKRKKEETCLKNGTTNSFSREDIKQKIRQTNLEKYGVEYPTQNKEIRLKAAKSTNNYFYLNHWKTNEKIICQGTWEKKTVEWLNENKIEFEWQSKIFETPILTKLNNETTYTPDFYLINEDKWIEIKGWFREEESKQKWEWFHRTYPNSELWNKNTLKEKGIGIK